MNKFIDEIKGKKVLVFGLGKQGGGQGDADWLTKHKAIVKVSDQDRSLSPDGQTREQIDWAQLIIKNPGVSDDHELLLYAKTLNIPVLTSAAVFVKYASIKTIGVTGTRGKSTTVALIQSLLERAYPGQIIVGGNIADTSCLSLFDSQDGLSRQKADKQYAILELSSFQLHNFHDLKVSPNYALLTNIYPDHLNRYPDMKSYQWDKQAIHLYQKPGDYYFEFPKAQTVMDWETSLPGLHNKENIAGMWAIAKALGINEELCRQVVKEFRGVPFRQEKIRTVGGVTYINDTTSTTPTASIMALQAADGPTIWITGGHTKNLPYTDLLDEVKVNQHLKKIIILGSKNIPDYVEALTGIAGNKIVGTAFSMSEAVTLAQANSEPGDQVLLSPGFASFDLFQNEFDRGQQFNQIVNEI